jgi:hypothetical protein
MSLKNIIHTSKATHKRPYYMIPFAQFLEKGKTLETENKISGCLRLRMGPGTACKM